MGIAPQDRALIDGCLAGDAASREAFVRRFSRLIFATLLGTLRSKGARIDDGAAEDLHNTVFVSFFDNNCVKLRQFQGRNGCTLASWVRMITVRTVLDRLRRDTDLLSRPEKRESFDLIRDIASSDQESPWERIVQKEQQRLIRKALHHLSPRDQLVIQLHCLDERPLAQVAAILNVSPSTIHSVKHRALCRLKETVTKMMQIPSGDARSG